MGRIFVELELKAATEQKELNTDFGILTLGRRIYATDNNLLIKKIPFSQEDRDRAISMIVVKVCIDLFTVQI